MRKKCPKCGTNAVGLLSSIKLKDCRICTKCWKSLGFKINTQDVKKAQSFNLADLEGVNVRYNNSNSMNNSYNNGSPTPYNIKMAEKIVSEIQKLSYEMVSTKEPSTFFDGFDEVIEKVKLLMPLEGKVKFIGEASSPSELLNITMATKDEDAEEFIHKWYAEINKNIYRADSEHEKIEICQRSFKSISKHIPQMSQSNIELIEKLKRECQESIGVYSITDESNPTIGFAEDYDEMDGHNFENFCAKLLMNNGYTNVKVTAGSGDFGADVLAERDGIKYAIQCKREKGNIGNKAVQEALSGKAHYKAHIGAVMTNQYFTSSAKKQAESAGIILWDRTHIEKLKAQSEQTLT